MSNNLENKMRTNVINISELFGRIGIGLASSVASFLIAFGMGYFFTSRWEDASQDAKNNYTSIDTIEPILNDARSILQEWAFICLLVSIVLSIIYIVWADFQRPASEPEVKRFRSNWFTLMGFVILSVPIIWFFTAYSQESVNMLSGGSFWAVAIAILISTIASYWTATFFGTKKVMRASVGIL